MTVQTIKLGGKRFVIVPEKDFRRLQTDAEEAVRQNKGDIAEAKRREKEPSIPLAQVKRRFRL
jgi:PHD/YefM family antitoxin component YafN of YafNO toxin-antitoxin module